MEKTPDALLRELTVLYVDDEPEIVESMERSLSRALKRVVTAANGLEALEKLKTEPVDAVITDIRMPDMDGLQLAAAIREHYGDLPVVILSAHNDEEYLLSAIELGVRKYLFKPVNINLLKTALIDVAQIVALKKQVAEQQALLNEYRDALDRAALVSQANAEGRLFYVNENFVRISGYSRQELYGGGFELITHPENPPSVFEQIRRTIEAGEVWQGVIKNRAKDGREYYVESTVVPLGGGEAICIDYEVTDRENRQHEKNARLIKLRTDQHKQFVESVGALRRELSEKDERILELANALSAQQSDRAKLLKLLDEAKHRVDKAEEQVLKLTAQNETMVMNHKTVLGKISQLEERNRQLSRMMENMRGR
ncbi:MAG: response regulator [Campylobacterales bacterium]